MQASPYTVFSDKQLVTLLQAGDRKAYAEIYDRFQGVLYTYAYRMVHDEEEAADLVQEVLLYLWEKREAIQLTNSLANYLYAAVRYRFFNLLDKERVRQNYAESLAAFADRSVYQTDFALREKELAALIEDAVQHLPPKMREVFEWSRKEQLSHREIADKLGITEKTVKNQINGALKILRKQLGNHAIWLLLLSTFFPTSNGP